MVLLALLAAVQVVVGGSDWDEADRRATAYDTDAVSSAWDREQLRPRLTGAPAMIKRCVASTGEKAEGKAAWFKVVISFHENEFSEVLVDHDSKLGRCVAAEIAQLALPPPPRADYAERIVFTFK